MQISPFDIIGCALIVLMFAIAWWGERELSPKKQSDPAQTLEVMSNAIESAVRSRQSEDLAEAIKDVLENLELGD